MKEKIKKYLFPITILGFILVPVVFAVGAIFLKGDSHFLSGF